MNTKNAVIIAVACLASVLVWLLRPESLGGHFGLWSLLPATVTIVFCFVTRNVVFALLLGVFAGGLVSGQLNLIDAFLIPALGSENYAQMLLVYLWALGSLLGLWNRNGGARHFAETLAKRFVNSRTSAKLFTWVLGVVFHQGGTISTVLTGTTVKPMSDRHTVAHEELAYIVDSTASPVATILPFNVWPVYIAGLLMIEPLAQLVPDQASAIKLYFMAIPFNFYAWLAVSMTLLFALNKLPLLNTPMARVVKRVNDTGELDAPDAQPMAASELTEVKLVDGYRSSFGDFLAPILTLLAFCAVPLALGNNPMVFEGFGMAVVVAFVLSVAKGMSINIAFEAMIDGVKGVTIGAVVLGLAVTLAKVSEQLGTASFVIDASAGFLSHWPTIYPSLLLVVCMLVAFSIGSSWGTYAVVFPIALPLALVLSTDPTFILLCFGAIVGGAVFGDQCSPISDTTVLASLACGADVMDHVKTQLPFALAAAVVSAVMYFVLSWWTLSG